MTRSTKLPPPTRHDVPTTPALVQQAIILQRQGKLAEAEAIYHVILSEHPRHFDALHLLGVAAAQRSNFGSAVELIGQAIAIKPDDAFAHGNLGNALSKLKRPEEALVAYDRALALKPDYPEAHNNRGNALLQLKRPEEAFVAYDRALALKPDYPEAHNNRGNALLQLVHPEEALAAYDRALALKPDYPEAQLNRGSALKKLGRPAEALAAYNRTLALNPNSPEAHNNRGNALLQLKRPEEALAAYDRTLTLKPDNPEAHLNRGNALGQLKRPEEALAAYERTLALKPDYAEAHLNHGNALKELGRSGDALAAYDRALALKPDYPEAHNNRGNALLELERPQEALTAYDRALALKPDYPEAHLNRGSALKKLGRPEEALAACDRALTLTPDYAGAHLNRGNALKKLGRPEEALAACERALTLKPEYPDAHFNRGNALLQLKRPEEAITAYGRALTLKSDYPEAYSNFGNALLELKRPEEALAAYGRALALKPDYPEARGNESLCRLLMGDFARGWHAYEWRWESSGELSGEKRNFPQPLWLGKESLAGTTILLHAEQGFGDSLQFCRYAGMVAALGARVILEVQPALKNLLARLEGPAQVLAKGEQLPAFDFQTPLLSLPLAFGTRLESIPARTPYLRADPARLAVWRERLGEDRRPRIGIAWSGRPTHGNDRNRSIPLSRFCALIDDDARFVCLQKEMSEADAALLVRRGDILDARRHLKDFAETAALVELMDLVVTVDTSVAHLAGALGKPTFLLLPFAPDWRWLLGRDDSPWYPSLRLFRQTRYNDWDDVFERVRRAR
ncbi:MAG: tetratricopeptide repeat protein [Sulfuritalea sp.]|nr:tetratricopeptide repeat protein [Sulfuritalea sp.]